MSKDGAETPAQAMSVPDVGPGRMVIGVQASELVGLPQYSNVTVGPFVAFRNIADPAVEHPDDPNKQTEQLKLEYQKLGEAVEQGVSEQRQLILNALKKFAADGGYSDVRNG